jgi:hypothetical protein
MFRSLVLLNEKFLTALGRILPLGLTVAGGTGRGPLRPDSPGGFAHGHNSDSQ